jgi:phenol hydroxylase P0 protein
MTAPARDGLSQASIRVLRVRNGRFVEFQFSLGDEELTIELIMPLAAFDEFRIARNAVLVPPDTQTAAELEQMAWRAGQPGLLRRARAVDDET